MAPWAPKLFVIGSLLLTGCATAPGEGSQLPRDLPDAFACNEWVDEDGNRLISPGEFKGVKSTFASFERVTFVARYEGVGSQIIWRLFGPEGTVFASGTSLGRFQRAYRWVWWDVEDLIDRDRIGRWRMEWYLEGSPTKVTRVRLTR